MKENPGCLSAPGVSFGRMIRIPGLDGTLVSRIHGTFLVTVQTPDIEDLSFPAVLYSHTEVFRCAARANT